MTDIIQRQQSNYKISTFDRYTQNVAGLNIFASAQSGQLCNSTTIKQNNYICNR